MNKTIIVLNTPSAVKEVIDKHSASTANRPQSIIAETVIPDNVNTGTARYGELGQSLSVL
jgi:hypothetical protein